MRKTKKIISGPMLEVISYPCSDKGRPLRAREPGQRSAEDNKRYNDTRAKKRLVRKVATNFGGEDLYLTLTYSPENAPEDLDQARRDMTNYFNRVKRRRAKAAKQAEHDLTELRALRAKMTNKVLDDKQAELEKTLRKLQTPLKYIYVVESKTYRRGERTGRKSYHIHGFVTGGLPERVMRSLWKGGTCVRCDLYRPEDYGPEAAAVYLMKGPEGARRICCSKNLDDPIERELTTGYTDRGIRMIEREHKNDAPYWEKKYPGYRFVRCEPLYNTYNCRWYMSVVMYRTAAPPPKWSVDGWFDEPWEEL